MQGVQCAKRRIQQISAKGQIQRGRSIGCVEGQNQETRAKRLIRERDGEGERGGEREGERERERERGERETEERERERECVCVCVCVVADHSSTRPVGRALNHPLPTGEHAARRMRPLTAAVFSVEPSRIADPSEEDDLVETWCTGTPRPHRGQYPCRKGQPVGDLALSGAQLQIRLSAHCYYCKNNPLTPQFPAACL